jgi:regulator of protease activity HflC (stomatin/prohibitin superfamily)
MVDFGIIIGIATLIGYALWASSFRVEEGQLAVVTRFGAALKTGKDLRTFGPGLHWKAPWERVIRLSMREQVLELSGEKGQRVMAEDGTVLRLDAALRYAPRADQIEAFLFGLHKPVEHIHGLFQSLLRGEIANMSRPKTADLATPNLGESFDEAAGSYGVIRKERHLLNRKLEEVSSRVLSDRYGVHFRAVDLVDILPPEELADALNAVMNAKSEADSQRFRAESECRRQVLAAEQGVEIARQHAQAAQKQMTTLASHLQALHRDGVLELYVERRRDEVLAESKTVYLKATSEAVGRGQK